MSELSDELRRYHRTLSPHIAARKQAAYLPAAADEIERAEAEIARLKAENATLEAENVRLRGALESTKRHLEVTVPDLCKTSATYRIACDALKGG